MLTTVLLSSLTLLQRFFSVKVNLDQFILVLLAMNIFGNDINSLGLFSFPHFIKDFTLLYLTDLPYPLSSLNKYIFTSLGGFWRVMRDFRNKQIHNSS